MLLKAQKGLSISIKLRPFFWQDSSTRLVRSTMTTGVISSNSIRPSGECAGSIVSFSQIALAPPRKCDVGDADSLDSPSQLDA